MIDHAPSTPTRPGPSRRPSMRAQAGFTLIEVVVSALIVIILAAGLSQALISTTHFSAAQQHRSQAQEVAEQDQERLRGLSAKQLASLATAQSYAVALGGMTYTVSSSASLLSTSGSTSCTTSGSGAVAYYHTASQVSWHDINGTQSLTEDSDITPPISGALITPVVDQTGAALPGVTVSAVGQASGGDQESGITDTNGCVIFTGLNADTYNLTFSDTGYVDVNGNSPVTDTATVTDAGTSRPTNNTEMMGQAGALTASFATSGVAGSQQATDLGYYGTGTSTSMSASKSVTASGTYGATSISAPNLFPFAFTGPSYTNNYAVWAGACRAEEPPTANLTYATISPGATPAVTVMEPALKLSVTYNGVSQVPSHVKLAYSTTALNSSNQPVCSDSWTEQTTSTGNMGVLAFPAVPFASTATTGSTASASGQAGTLTACADYNGYRAYSSAFTTSYSATTTATVAITSSTSNRGTC